MRRFPAELIIWPPGTAPAGEYEILLDYWSSCGGNITNFTVEVGVCGHVRTFWGSFHPDEASGGGSCGVTQEDHDDAGCVVITSFFYDPACPE